MKHGTTNLCWGVRGTHNLTKKTRYHQQTGGTKIAGDTLMAETCGLKAKKASWLLA